MAKDSETVKTKMAVMQNDIDYIKEGMNDIKTAVNDIKKNIEEQYVTRAEFAPIKQVVYGIIGLLITAVFGALLSLVVK